MKKALQTKISGTKKFFRKVLSKPSISSDDHLEDREIGMAEEALLRNELDALRDQVTHLKTAINAMQEEVEHKEVYIGNLAREKEKIYLDLLKTKRSNTSLAQQLEDERKFYFNEKQIYCKEMNECKKLKQRLSSTALSTSEDKNAEDYKKEIEKLKQTLNQTLQANYNLSIKFLRMKNTKTCLKSELQATQLEHKKLENEYKSKIEHLTTDLNDLVDEKLATSISPSNKKYLQLVKQNSCLVYENLCLQLEVDNLSLKFEKMKLERTRSETNSRLKYIHSDEVKTVRKDNSKKVRIHNEKPIKLDREPQPGCSRDSLQTKTEEKVLKLFERKEKSGVPTIQIVNEKKPKGKKTHKKKEDRVKSTSSNSQPVKYLEMPDFQINIDDSRRQQIVEKDLAKLSLFHISDINSTVSSEMLHLGRKLSRSRSFPDILHSEKFSV